MTQTRFVTSAYYRWLGIALAIRFFASWTHSSWFHPDEWFQTVEFAQWITKGFLYYTHEVGLHLRNLCWPLALALPLKVASWIGDSLAVRIFCIQIFASTLGLGTLWGTYQLQKKVVTEGKAVPSWLTHLGFALLVLPWFTVFDGVSPRSETISTSLIWLSLGFAAQTHWALCGAAAVGAVACRYPSALLAGGVVLGVVIERWRARDRRALQRLGLGILASLVVCGVPDAIFYGRPWESLWMYVQYNVVSGAAGEHFGTQPLSVYGEFLSWRWLRYGGLNAPLGVAIGFAALWGTVRGLARFKPWALGLAAYTVGHLVIAHREPRFLLPAEALVYWAAFEGALELIHFEFWRKLAPLKPIGRVALVIYFAVNALFLFKAVWGETWTPHGTYLEASRHLRDHPDACAIVTIRYPISVLLPWKRLAPTPAVGTVWATNTAFSYAARTERPIDWTEFQPECRANSQVLLHVHRPEGEWTQAGCELLASGVLSIAPRSLWPKLLERDWVRGPWYACPASVIALFPMQKHWRPFSQTVGHHEALPRWGATPRELMELARKTSPPPSGYTLPGDPVK